MHDALAKTRLAREMIRQVYRIAIAGQIGEGDDVIIHHGLHQGFAHADAQILEIIDFERR